MSSFSRTRASLHLDAIRACAALTVLLNHWRALLFVDFGALTRAEKVLAAPLYVVSQGGHMAVIIFFVLSGYLIGGTVIRSRRAGTFSPLDYGRRRLVRLWVVLLPALLVGGALDCFGMHQLGTWALYHGLVNNHSTVDASQTLNFWGALRNITFLQNIRGGGAFGSNVPLWSIAYEFWYYMLFPLAYMTLVPGTRSLKRLIPAALFFGVCLLVGADVLEMFPFWLGGALLHVLPTLRLRRPHRAGAAVLYILSFVTLSAASHVMERPAGLFLLDSLMTIATVVFLWILLSSTAEAPGSLYSSAARRVAAFSYTLYTIHFPILVLFTGLVLGNGPWHPDAPHLALAFIPLIMTFALTGLMYWLFESRTQQLQRQIDRMAALRSAHLAA